MGDIMDLPPRRRTHRRMSPDPHHFLLPPKACPEELQQPSMPVQAYSLSTSPPMQFLEPRAAPTQCHVLPLAPCASQPVEPALSQHQHTDKQPWPDLDKQSQGPHATQLPILVPRTYQSLPPTPARQRHRNDRLSPDTSRKRHSSRHHLSWLRHLLPLLAVLCASSTLCVGSAQQVHCPCLPVPGTAGCNATQTPITTTSSNFPGASFSQCMPMPQYNTRWGAIFFHTCWNVTCFPSQFSNSILTTTISNFTTGISKIPSGSYLVVFGGPPADGGNLITGSLNVSYSSAPANYTAVTNGSTLIVPGGLEGVSISWTYPTSLTTGNFAELAITSLKNVVAKDAASPPANSTVTCSDVMSTTDGPIECPDGQVRMWVWGNVSITGLPNNGRYQGLNFTSQIPPFPEPTPVNVTRCVPRPYFDPYSQQMIWNITWSLPCYVLAQNTTPWVMVTEPFQPTTVDYMPVNTTLAFTLMSPLKSFTNNDGSSYTMPIIEFGDNNKTVKYNTTIISGENTTFLAPSQGIRNMSLGLILTGQILRVRQGSATYILQSIPYYTPDTDSLADDFQLIKYTIQALVPGNQTNSTLSLLGGYLGQGGSVSLLGWQVTARLLFRDYSIVYSCAQSTLDTLLTAIAISVGVPRYLLSAACVELLPGQQDQYILASSNSRKLLDLPSTSGLCADARIALNVSYLMVQDNSSMVAYPQLTGALSVLEAGVKYVMAQYDTSLYCTAPLTFNTVAGIQGVTTTERDYDKTEAACTSITTTALNIVTSLAATAGIQITVLNNGIICSGYYNCIDCWPYPIAQWAIVMMACAALLVVVVVLAIRLKIVQRQEAAKPVPAGVLDVQRTVLAVKAKQAQERIRAQQELLKQQEMDAVDD